MVDDRDVRSRILTAALFLPLLAGCKAGKQHRSKAVPLRSASAAKKPPAPPPRHKLARRGTIDAKAAEGARDKVLHALARARVLAAQKKPKQALAALSAVWPLDPSGAVLALEASREAGAAGARKWALRFAWLAVDNAVGDRALEKKAQAALDKAGGPDKPASLGGPFKTPAEACAAITAALRSGKVALPSGQAAGNVHCAAEYTMKLGAKKLQGAVALRVESRGKLGTDLLGWVALETPKGLLVEGPVEKLLAPSVYGLTNDYTLDLQHVDALPGGSPEVVARVDERRTLVDVALGEKTQVDDAHVVLITTDRGKPELSKRLMLSSKVLRNRLDPKDHRLPAGFHHSKLLGKGQEYRMKVSWSGANSITLTRFLGNATPPDQGVIKLFK